MNSTFLHRHRPLLFALLVALALKATLLLANGVPFNSDEAVVALMARHILQGERPIFFYGQVYLGSLDAWLIAGAFAVFGESVLMIRLVQVTLYLGTLVTTYQLGLRIYSNRWIASVAALCLALPPVLVTLYTTATLGGYGEVLLIGNILLLLTLDLAEAEKPIVWKWLALGLLGGLGFWGFPFIGVYLVPVVLYLLAPRRWRFFDWLVCLAGFVAGAAPWLWATLTTGGKTLAEMGGSAIAGASVSNPVFAAFQHLFYFILLGLTVIWGLRAPWGAQFLALPLAPFVLFINMAVVAFVLRVIYPARPREAIWRRRWLLLGVCFTLIAAFILTPFGADPSGRYFLPLAAPGVLLLAEMLAELRAAKSLRQKWFANGLALGVVLFNLLGTAQSLRAFPPGLTTQFDPVAQVDQRALPTVMRFLRAQGETRGYTNYWVEFPMAFLSDEDLLFAARLPYHLDFSYTTRYDRYAPYSQAVAESERVAYVTTRHPALDKRLRLSLQALGVSFKEAQIGDFHIFFALSRAVRPEEMGLGMDCCPK